MTKKKKKETLNIKEVEKKEIQSNSKFSLSTQFITQHKFILRNYLRNMAAIIANRNHHEKKIINQILAFVKQRIYL